MDYLYECLGDTKPRVASIHYYAYRKLDEEKTLLLYALDKLKYEWVKASEMYQEPYPALQKLQWWKTEILRLEIGDLKHPLMKILANYIGVSILNKWLTHDLNYALQTISEGRKNQINQDLGQSFFGIAMIKAYILGVNDEASILVLNRSDELLRYLLFSGKHYARNISLEDKMAPNMQAADFHQIADNLIEKATVLRQQLKPFSRQLLPLIIHNKLQLACANSFNRKIDSPFRESIMISPVYLLLVASFSGKF